MTSPVRPRVEAAFLPSQALHGALRNGACGAMITNVMSKRRGDGCPKGLRNKSGGIQRTRTEKEGNEGTGNHENDAASKAETMEARAETSEDYTEMRACEYAE